MPEKEKKKDKERKLIWLVQTPDFTMTEIERLSNMLNSIKSLEAYSFVLSSHPIKALNKHDVKKLIKELKGFVKDD